MYGPGTIDCKGGIAIALLAMDALYNYGIKKHTRLILTSDEEISNVLGAEKEQYFLGRDEISNQDFLGIVLDYNEISENIYEVDGDMNIYDFFELVEYDDRDFETEYTTFGGWCTDVLEKFPEVDDTFDFANFTVTIISVENVRVGKARIEIHEEVEDEE